MKIIKKLIRLDKIVGVLPSAQKAYDCLSGVMPLVRDPEIFSIEMCRMMLTRTPPMLVLKGNKYYLFAGYREWQLALYKLDRTEKISCQIVTDANDFQLNEMAWNDAYGPMLLYGISPNLMGLQCKEAIIKIATFRVYVFSLFDYSPTACSVTDFLRYKSKLSSWQNL